MQHTINLDAETERQLQTITNNQGISPDSIIRQAITSFLHDWSDYREAKEVNERHQLGHEKSSPLNEVKDRLGLVD